MTIIHSENLSTSLIIGIDGQIGTFLKLYLTLPRHRKTTEGDISESMSPALEQIVLRCILGEILFKI